MTQICPKCSYVRKETDTCPDWQCPSCSVAYHKVSANGSADLAQYRRHQSQQNPAASGLGFFKKILISVVITVICIHTYINHKNKLSLKNQAELSALSSSTKNSAAQQPRVILFGTEWCGYCAASRDYFRKNGIAFTDHDIEKNYDAYLEYQRLGGKGVPLLKIGDEVIKGYNEDRMRFLLEAYYK